MNKNSINHESILVAGGAGFIGSNFIRLFLKKHPNFLIVNFDKLTYSGNLDNLKDISRNKNYKFIKGDITNKKQIEAVIKKYKPAYAINFAAETHVDRSVHGNAAKFVETNVKGVFNLLEIVKNNQSIKKFVQVSTDEVYGSLALDDTVKFSEDSPFLPNAPYGATKASGDLLCRAYYSSWRVPVIVTHASNTYGPYQYPEKLIPFFILRMLGGKTLPLYGDGENIRDWLYVEDHCRALELCLFKALPGKIYNIGAGEERSNIHIAEMILRHFGKDSSQIEFITDRPGHDRKYSVDSGLIAKDLGWTPKTNFETAFKKTVSWYIDNRVWLNHILKKTETINAHIAS